MAVNTRSKPYSNTIDEVINQSYDGEFNVIVGEPVGYDGKSVQRTVADSLAIKITTSGDHKYIAVAAPGTAQSEAKWQVKDFYSNGSTMTITWADGDANFDNVATDLTALSYS